MVLRLRLLGMTIVACGLAICYGAVELWPTQAVDAPLAQFLGILRMVGAAIAAPVGVGNVCAGLVVLLAKPARE